MISKVDYLSLSLFELLPDPVPIELVSAWYPLEPALKPLTSDSLFVKPLVFIKCFACFCISIAKFDGTLLHLGRKKCSSILHNLEIFLNSDAFITAMTNLESFSSGVLNFSATSSSGELVIFKVSFSPA